MGVLTIFLDKVTNLDDDDTIGKSDPYVKFHLEKDGGKFIAKENWHRSGLRFSTEPFPIH